MSRLNWKMFRLNQNPGSIIIITTIIIFIILIFIIIIIIIIINYSSGGLAAVWQRKRYSQPVKHYISFFGLDQTLVTKWLDNTSRRLVLGAFYIIFRPRPVGMGRRPKLGRTSTHHRQHSFYNFPVRLTGS